MTNLTENLLLLACTDKAIQLQTELVELNSLLLELIQLYKSQAKLKQLLLHVEIEPDLCLSGDRILLKHLFGNLLQNALYYTAEGGSVIVVAGKMDSCLKIKIEDTGIGIAPEHLNLIFERFWRVDKSRSHQSGKSGLGLAIVQEIVRLHKGKILVDSELGKGSSFMIYFPA